MKNHTKAKTFDIFCQTLSEKYPDIDEHIRRKIANDLMNESMIILKDNSDGLSKSASDALLDHEKHRKQFRDHIENIQKHSKVLLDSFKKQTFVKPDRDKNNKPVLVGRTRMVDEMVDFLNKLNKSVMDFYTEVYKIEDEKEFKTNGIEQISLF
jgi:hypothetical protein